jgi:hypothetical protein
MNDLAGRCPKAAFPPVWWAALAVLVLNDHALKGSGVVPGWLTGKLSDFAGLIVAPVLIVAALGARSRRGVAAVVLAVGGGFAAVKLSRTLADAFEAPFATLGVACHVWTDPTDLVAVSVLPLVYRLLVSAPRLTAVLPERRRSLFNTLAVALGGLACVATSVGRNPRGIGLIINATHEDRRLSMHQQAGSVDCAALEADPEAVIAAVELDQGVCHDFWMQSFVVIETPEREEPCGVVVLSTPGLPPTALFWTNLAERELDRSSSPEGEFPVGSYLHLVGKSLYFDPAPTMDARPYVGDVTDACAGTP